MPVLSGFRPGGNRLVWPTDIKIKGLQIQRLQDEPTSVEAYVNWRWDEQIAPQVDLAVDKQGANLVKFYSSIKAVLDGNITQATHDAQMRQFIEYAATKGVYVYWCPHFVPQENDPGNDPATLEQILNSAAILAEYPHVVAMDCSNEIFDYPVQAEVQAEVYPAVKAVAPSLPLTVSFGVWNPGRFTAIPYDLFAPYVDFWDFHPYYANNNTADPNSGSAVPSDFDAFRRSPYFKPFLIGECGQSLHAGEQGQTDRWASLGVLSAMPDCMGVVGYATQDCLTSDGDYGIYSNAGDRRAWMADVFRDDWPARR